MEKGLQQLNANQRVEIWGRRIAACRNSGMTVREWCGQEGLSEKTYYYWQHKLYRLVSEEAQFVELPVSQGTAGVENAVAAMEAGGVRIEIYAGADAATLREIIRAVKQC